MTAPLTPAEQAAAEVLAGHHNASDAAYSYSSAAFAVEARAVVAAVEPIVAEKTLRDAADRFIAEHPWEGTRYQREHIADDLRKYAAQPLSRPTSEETQK